MMNVSSNHPALHSTVTNMVNSKFSENGKLVPTLLLLTCAPEHPTALAGFNYAKDYCKNWCEKFSSNPQNSNENPIPLSLFLYGDGVHIANRLRWLPSDQINVAKLWQNLVLDYQLSPQLCVATALARGVVDSDNAKRHQLEGDNVAAGFTLVGLGELAMRLHEYEALPEYQIVQF